MTKLSTNDLKYYTGYDEKEYPWGTECPNSGRLWTKQHEAKLEELFLAGTPLPLVCKTLGRTAAAILARFTYCNMTAYTTSTANYGARIVSLQFLAKRGITDPEKIRAIARQRSVSVVQFKPETTPGIDATEDHPINQGLIGKPLTLKEDKTMTATVSVIKNVTFINNRDASEVSDDEIFGLIAKLEGQVARLTAITHKPKKLNDRIAGIEADIAKLVEYVDGR